MTYGMALGLGLEQVSQTTQGTTGTRSFGYYNQVLPFLTDARIYEEKLCGYRYFVDLVSREYELQDGYPVPKKAETIDVLVTQPTEAAIKLLVASCRWLEGYEIVGCTRETNGYGEF